ncbi:MAG TPA: pyridoxal-dependent decarboxylase [Bryobacteraceae bacterium]|nr:pyridoxal-dependent decarboxylase [Bryobacteraceae bacterium]
MSPEQFRRAAHEAVDWVADYLATIRDLPVLPRVRPGDLTDQLPAAGPERGEAIDDILRDFRDLIVPATTHWNHPRFHAYFSVSAAGPAIIAEMLAAALNVNHMVWQSGPAQAELEQVSLGWLRDWLGLPESFFGVMYDTASISTMHALICARELVCPEARREGSVGGRLVVYTSEQAHSSVEKSAIAIGIGQNNVRRIPVDDEFRMLPEALEEAIESDLHRGKQPCCIVPTVGTTSTTSVDPVRAIAAIAERARAWLHVDASCSGAAAILPEYRWLLDGCERAQSFVVNPHKWLFTPVDLSAFYTSRPDILKRALSLVPEYLKTREDARALNFMDYGVPLGRRFRALKLWFVLRWFGREGITRILRNHLAWTHELADEIRAHPDFELCAPVPVSLICFRYRGTDDQNRELLERINASGRAFLSHTVLNGRYVLRLSVGNVRATCEDLRITWETIQSCAAGLPAS